MNRAERRRAARDMTHATQSIMRARGGYEREYERGAKDAERHATFEDESKVQAHG